MSWLLIFFLFLIKVIWIINSKILTFGWLCWIVLNCHVFLRPLCLYVFAEEIIVLVVHSLIIIITLIFIFLLSLLFTLRWPAFFSFFITISFLSMLHISPSLRLFVLRWIPLILSWLLLLFFLFFYFIVLWVLLGIISLVELLEVVVIIIRLLRMMMSWVGLINVLTSMLENRLLGTILSFLCLYQCS